MRVSAHFIRLGGARAGTANAAPALPAEPDWDEAFLRVEGYLRAHGLESPVLLGQIAGEIVEEAKARVTAGAVESAPAIAMEITHARIGAWFARLHPAYDWKNDRDRAKGRLALIVTSHPSDAPNRFLSPESEPAVLAAALDSFELLPGPEVQFRNMPPAPLEFVGFNKEDLPRPDLARIWLPFRVVAWWLVIGGFFGAAWAFSH